MLLAPGARLGPNEILSAIGAGGMGEVYKARDTRLDRLVAICAALIVALGPGVAMAQVPVAETRAQVIQYADGRVVSTVLQPKGSMWTPKFPRIAGVETSRNGSTLYALDVAHVVEGPDVVFTVSLFYGGLQERVWVADVRVTPEQPVRVEALRAYGVEPITLSLMVVPPTLVNAPAVVNASSLLDVRVDPVAPHVPVYRVVLTNHSTRALMAIQYALYRGDDVVLSGRRREERNKPLAGPGQEYVFELPISRGNSDTWGTIDRAVISSIMWDDGLFEGDPAPAEQERMFREGRAISIRQVLALLRSANRLSLSDFRSKFAGMRLFDPIMGRIRDAALAQFDELAGRGDRAAISAWLTEQITEYEAWLGRVTQGKSIMRP